MTAGLPLYSASVSNNYRNESNTTRFSAKSQMGRCISCSSYGGLAHYENDPPKWKQMLIANPDTWIETKMQSRPLLEFFEDEELK